MLDYKRYKGREMPFAEQVASVKNDIDFGARLGMKYIRALVSIAPEVLVAAAPYAEEKGIKILIEVHAPLHFDHPWIIRHAEAFEKSGSDALGFLPDMGMFGPAIAMAETLRHNAAFEPKRMLDYMHRIHNIHGKFYQMDADCVEPSIPYDRIVAVLKQGGYQGYICSEYEGNRWIEDVEEPDSVEQVRRQQVMLARLLGETEVPTIKTSPTLNATLAA